MNIKELEREIREISLRIANEFGSLVCEKMLLCSDFEVLRKTMQDKRFKATSVYAFKLIKMGHELNDKVIAEGYVWSGTNLQSNAQNQKFVFYYNADPVWADSDVVKRNLGESNICQIVELEKEPEVSDFVENMMPEFEDIFLKRVFVRYHKL
ncbi:hypothetical protein ACHJH3_06710 [Campylobacter sp. MOP7]|uniref:hypothetical protein n=1 Tax=Campylobacter canis TaxID=3378588 RepID=UPI00387E62A4